MKYSSGEQAPFQGKGINFPRSQGERICIATIQVNRQVAALSCGIPSERDRLPGEQEKKRPEGDESYRKRNIALPWRGKEFVCSTHPKDEEAKSQLCVK